MAGHMKKKRCNHDKDSYMPVPEGYDRKDFLKKNHGGLDGFTQTRIKDFISYFCASNIPDNEALFLIKKQFGITISRMQYHKLKTEVMSNVEVQAWLNSYAKLGFVAAHIQDIERTKMMADRIVSAFLIEIAKDHEERNYQLLSQLTRDYEKLTKLSVVLRAGAPILARIKAMIDASNIRAIENDPTMPEEEREKILSRRSRKTQPVITVPNTITDDPTDVTVVTRYVGGGKNEHKEERGKMVKYNKQNSIVRKSSNKEEEKEDTSFEGKQQEVDNIPGQRSESGREFIQFLMEESKSDDIIPRRINASFKLDTEE